MRKEQCHFAQCFCTGLLVLGPWKKIDGKAKETFQNTRCRGAEKKVQSVRQSQKVASLVAAVCGGGGKRATKLINHRYSASKTASLNLLNYQL